MHPDDLIQLIKDSGLRGRGGAGFPTGLKWGFIPQGDGKPHYLVINADEGEPGTCKDLPLMTYDPHSLIEGAIIASYAIRANRAFIYIRGEAVHAARRLRNAVREAYEAGYLGENILAPGSTSSWSCTAGPVRTSAVKRPPCWTPSKASAASPGCGRRSRPSPASTRARPWSTTSAPSPACPTSCWAAPTGGRAWARRSRPAR